MSLINVVNLIAAPPFGVVTVDTTSIILTSGPKLVLQRPRGPINVDAVGVTFSFITIPAAFGWRNGLVPEYEETILQWAPVYTSLQLPLLGPPAYPAHDFYPFIQDVHHEGEFLFFPQLLPARLEVFVQVGCVVDMRFLLILPH